MKVLKRITFLLLVILIGIQFYRPEQNSLPGDHMADFITETNPSDEVRMILKQSCYDCHSNHTEYPWYNSIAPVSHWIADHVKDGKKHLNFSEWSTYELKKKDHKLEELIEEVEESEMPLREYTWTHKEAQLSAEQKAALMDWAKRTRALYQLNLRPE
ncbi:heme-binding domain-containing protein [Maribacter sp. 2307UL18-2]|uniref:heme-binding domain-containing protein n=1 Tax=Maribacter sp. 2307UL18-2 TaxID=3386274 RepID=UPI0039BCC4D2